MIGNEGSDILSEHVYRIDDDIVNKIKASVLYQVIIDRQEDFEILCRNLLDYMYRRGIRMEVGFASMIYSKKRAGIIDFKKFFIHSYYTLHCLPEVIITAFVEDYKLYPSKEAVLFSDYRKMYIDFIENY